MAFGLTLGLSHDPSCGGVDSPTSGPNAPCTRDKDCRDGLVCSGGVCAVPDAGPADDGGADVATMDADHGG
jgi:hypothetical protein